MAIYLPPTAEETEIQLDELTPKEIVSELDKHVVGQHAAKRAVAIALRNRMRRQKLTPELAEEIIPKNIIMIGPTGVGKTEIARDMVREEKLEDVAEKAEMNAEERLLDLLLPAAPTTSSSNTSSTTGFQLPSADENDSQHRTREKLRQQLREGKLDERMVELDVREKGMPSFEIISNQGVEEMGVNIKDMLPNIFGQQTKKRKMKVGDAMEYLIQEEEQRLIDMDQVQRIAVDRVEQSAIIFLDEIDKIAGREGGHGP